ncbi:hypothetical protein glysoja_021208 [Glycine soja]|nr:hypothetical protein glysoja_021208 [Glycine soja]
MDKGAASRFKPNAPKREHCICITVFLLLLGIILLVLWLAYHPNKPRFTVASASVYSLNATSPPLMSIAMQFNVKHSAVSLSPEIGGVPVPVSEDVSNGLAMDENYGVVGVKLVLFGRLRWRAGDINSAHYGLYVKCDVLMGLRKGFVGQVPLLGAPGNQGLDAWGVHAAKKALASQ